MNRSRFIRVAFGVAAYGAIQLIALPAAAKGIPERVTITGPGLAAPVVETDPRVLPALGILGLMDSQAIAPPDTPGPAYTLARDGFDRVRYYPGPGGGLGYVYYEGLVDDGGKIAGASEYDGKWYLATRAGDGVLRAVLAAHGVALPGDVPTRTRVTRDADKGSTLPWAWVLPAFLVGTLMGGGAVRGLTVTRHHQSLSTR